MLKLCGFATSNYYNKVKLALLEKGVPFEEELVWPSRDDAHLARTPMGKLPFIETPQGNLSESSVILEYLEDAYPEHPLYPRDPFARAKNRELIRFMELHVELVARRLYAEAFFGGKVSDETKQEVERDLTKGIKALSVLVKFLPYVAGDTRTMADCAAYAHLPLVSMATKAIYGRDFFDVMPQVKPYIKMMGERPHVQKVAADRKVNTELMLARRK
jgi:glutathione S-transferase